MLDDATTEATVPAPRCNWCSAVLPSDHETTCPSCGATLVPDAETSVPGVTAIDAEAILRNARNARAKPRSRLLGWISGDYDAGVEASAPKGSLAPPDEAVRREMLRLELEAQVANAEAEVGAMAADAAVEEGRSLAPVAGAADDPSESAADGSPDVAPDAEPAADATDDHAEAPPA